MSYLALIKSLACDAAILQFHTSFLIINNYIILGGAAFHWRAFSSKIHHLAFHWKFIKNSWMNHLYVGLMKSSFDEKLFRWKAVSMKSCFNEKPLQWKAASMKSLFDEKPLQWKAALMKSLFNEKPLQWKASSMKSRFNEKPLRWKAALMKSRFDEKPLQWKAASMKSCFDEKPLRWKAAPPYFKLVHLPILTTSSSASSNHTHNF
jgi:hypothetical protein